MRGFNCPFIDCHLKLLVLIQMPSLMQAT